jgi:hypothetical protein
MPVIPATQEMNIRRIMVHVQHRQNVNETPISTKKPDVVVYVFNPAPSYMEGIDKRMAVQDEPWAKNMRPYLENN